MKNMIEMGETEMNKIDSIIKEFLSKYENYEIFYKRQHGNKTIVVFRNDKDELAGIAIDSNGNDVKEVIEGDKSLADIINKLKEEDANIDQKSFSKLEECVDSVDVAKDEKTAKITIVLKNDENQEEFETNGKQCGNGIAEEIYKKCQVVPINVSSEIKDGKMILSFEYDADEYENYVKEVFEVMKSGKLNESSSKSIYGIDGSFYNALFEKFNTEIDMAIARKIPFGIYNISEDGEFAKFINKVNEFLSSALGIPIEVNSHIISDPDGIFQNFSTVISEDDIESLEKYSKILEELEFKKAEEDSKDFEKFNV